MSSKALLKVLTTPSKIASALDWKKLNGSVLSLDIHKDRIGLAIASHPSFGEKPTSLEDIPLGKRGHVTRECKERLAALAKDYRVCGVVVSWPLQPDTGRMGASCGRVLHTLDDLLEDSSLCNTSTRPLCLWDGDHSLPDPEDRWGRSEAYSRTSSKTVHRASVEQYNHDENIVAANVWEDFCRSHWPDLYEQEQAAKNVTTATTTTQPAAPHRKPTSVDESNWEDSSSYVNAALL
jgi:RNase H-fold protein (predicted Holliday junction resolvase)